MREGFLADQYDDERPGEIDYDSRARDLMEFGGLYDLMWSALEHRQPVIQCDNYYGVWGIDSVLIYIELDGDPMNLCLGRWRPVLNEEAFMSCYLAVYRKVAELIGLPPWIDFETTVVQGPWQLVALGLAEFIRPGNHDLLL